MKSSLLLRLAAVVLFLQALGHTLGGVIFYRPHSPAEAAVLSAMQSSRIAVAGTTRSLWDFYYGWGLAVGALSFMLAGIVWTLGRLSSQPRFVPGTLVAWVVAGCVAQIALCLRYFFFLPTLLLTVAAILCVAAMWFDHTARKNDQASARES